MTQDRSDQMIEDLEVDGEEATDVKGGRKAGGAPQGYLQVELENTLISSWS